MGCLKSLFLEVLNKMRERKVKINSLLWITSELRQMRKPNSFKRQAIKQNSNQAWNNYEKAKNEVNDSIREVRANFFNDSIKKYGGNWKETS